MQNTHSVMKSNADVTKPIQDVIAEDESVTNEQHDLVDIADTFARLVSDGVVPTEWTREVVMDRLDEAIKLVHRTAGRVGPKGFGKSMPDYEYSALDLWYQQTQTDEERERGDFERNRPMRGASTYEVGQADEALGWARRFVADERWRKALYSWMRSKALRKPWKKLCRAEGVNYRTATARRDRAVALIVYGLAQDPPAPKDGEV